MTARLIRSQELIQVARAFDVRRSEALMLVDAAAGAIERARRLARSDDRSYRRFLRLMVGAVKAARVRTS